MSLISHFRALKLNLLKLNIYNNLLQISNILEKTDLEKYVESLSPMELKALKIAQDHLETSYDMEKTIGFKEWKEKQDKSP